MNYFNKGLYDSALLALNKSIESEPEKAILYVYRADTYYFLGQVKKEISDYNKSIMLDSTRSDLFRARGIAYFLMGEYDSTIADQSKAIELDPKNDRAYFSRGDAYYDLGKYGNAIEDYNKAIGFNPKYHRTNEYRYVSLINTCIGAKVDKTFFEKKLLDYVSNNYSTDWFRTISKYYLGIDSVTDIKILEIANEGTDKKAIKDKLCEAYYYLGEVELGKEEREIASKYFEASATTPFPYCVESQHSRAILQRMKEGKQ